MVRKDDLPTVTWPHLAGATVLLVALITTVLSVSNAAEDTVKEHDESGAAHTQKILSHNTDKFAHEQMRKMMKEEMEPMFNAQTTKILEAIKKSATP